VLRDRLKEPQFLSQSYGHRTPTTNDSIASANLLLAPTGAKAETVLERRAGRAAHGVDVDRFGISGFDQRIQPHAATWGRYLDRCRDDLIECECDHPYFCHGESLGPLLPSGREDSPRSGCSTGSSGLRGTRTAFERDVG
jgi:hypothetical protein